MIDHQIERRGSRLCVTLTCDLGLLQSENPEALRLVRQALDDVAQNLVEVAQLCQEEGEVGTVKWFDVLKGYGFISTVDRQDVFVHRDQVRGAGYQALRPKQRVRFKRRIGTRSLEALDVEPADD